jgi:hypothetical protein
MKVFVCRVTIPYLQEIAIPCTPPALDDFFFAIPGTPPALGETTANCGLAHDGNRLETPLDISIARYGLNVALKTGDAHERRDVNLTQRYIARNAKMWTHC